MPTIRRVNPEGFLMEQYILCQSCMIRKADVKMILQKDEWGYSAGNIGSIVYQYFCIKCEPEKGLDE